MGTSAAPVEFWRLALLALLLGARHGLDADHLAAIDGLTRSNAHGRPRLARNAGGLFSLGHGSVVLVVASTTSLVSANWEVPAWVQSFGAWFSISVLVMLALLNISATFRADPQEVLVLVGWRAGFLSRCFSAASVPMVLAVGALFALSFDTLSQAALFSVMSARYGGLQAAAVLAVSFTTGMLAVDAANGLWVSRMMRRADRTARVASRLMGLSVAGVGLLTAGLGVAVQIYPATAAWCEGKEIWFGVAVVGIMFASYLVAMRLAARPCRRVVGDSLVGL